MGPITAGVVVRRAADDCMAVNDVRDGRAAVDDDDVYGAVDTASAHSCFYL